MAFSKIQWIINVGEGMEKREHCGGNVNYYSQNGKQYIMGTSFFRSVDCMFEMVGPDYSYKYKAPLWEK